MGRVKTALEQAKVSKEVIDGYLSEAMSSDYNHLLSVSVLCLETNGIEVI